MKVHALEIPEAKDRSEFLEKMSSTMSKLIELAREKNIKIISTNYLDPLIDRYMEKDDVLPTVGYGIFPELGLGRVIGVSKEGLIWWEKNKCLGELEFAIAHEIGHFETRKKRSSCSFLDPPKNRRFRYCTLSELRADERGLKILNRICEGIKNWNPEIYGKRMTAKEFWRMRCNRAPRVPCTAPEETKSKTCPDEIQKCFQKIITFLKL